MMKKTFLAFALAAFVSGGAFAQVKSIPPQVKKVKNNDQSKTKIKFKTTTHDFGILKEGDAAVADFTFKNTSKEPIIIQNVKPSCGCTTPYWSKDPIAPGKKGVIKASYGTKGRPGAFNKSITVFSTAGKSILYIKGIVKRAPQASAPKKQSLMRVN